MLLKFLKKLLSFFSPIILFLLYVEIGLNFIPTSYSKIKHYFYLQQNQIDVLIIGTSDPQLGVNPKYIKKYKSFNLSNVSQSIYYSTELVIMNLSELKNLKMVIMNIGPWDLSAIENNPIEKWRHKFYYYYWNIAPESGEPQFTWNFKTGLYDFKTIINYALQGFYHVPTPYIDNIEPTGWERGYFEYSHEILNDEAAKMEIFHRLKYVKFKLNKKKLKCINNLKNELDKRDITLMFIQLPLSKYFLKYMPEKLITENYKILDSISCSTGIPYYNFHCDTNYTDKDFRDVNHLNYIGAEKFSKTLSKIIDKNLN